jgi:TRAP-type C4-dicarboxylate transport system substrate-binding protein
LSSEQQKIVTDAATASSLIEFDLALTGNEAALKTMKETGVQIVDISDAERKRIEEKLQPVIIDLAKSATGVDGMGLYNKIKAIK